MTEQTNPKDLVRWLDRAAERAEMAGARAASPKQRWFLATLLAKAGVTPSTSGLLDANATLTSREASAQIGLLLTH